MTPRSIDEIIDSCAKPYNPSVLELVGQLLSDFESSYSEGKDAKSDAIYGLMIYCRAIERRLAKLHEMRSQAREVSDVPPTCAGE